MMKKTTKTIAAFLLLISTAYSLFLLVEREQQLAYFLTEHPKLSNVFISVAALPLVILILAASIMMLAFLWEKHETSRKVAYLCLIAEGVLSLLSNIAYLGILEENAAPLFQYLAGSIATIAAGILLIFSIKKCSVPHIVLISLCCVACLIASWEALLMEIPLIAACLLTNLQPKQEKRENHDETGKEELS